MDWFSRRVLSWRLSITLEVAFCLEVVEEALARHGKPEIFNTDQGSQFTSVDFTGLLLANTIAISMDGRGAWRDNFFVERLWRSVKYEEVYLRAYASVAEARASIGRYLAFYNGKRPHSSLGARTPEQAYSHRDHLGERHPQPCADERSLERVGRSEEPPGARLHRGQDGGSALPGRDPGGGGQVGVAGVRQRDHLRGRSRCGAGRGGVPDQADPPRPAATSGAPARSLAAEGR